MLSHRNLNACEQTARGRRWGESEHGAVYSRKWSPGVLSVQVWVGLSSEHPHPRLHTLARPQEGCGPFSGMACPPALGQSGRYPALCFSRSPFPQQEIPRDLWVLKVKYSIDGSSSPGFLFKMNMKRLIHLTSRICLNISEFWFWVEVAPWPLPSAWSPISPLYFPYSGGPEPAQVVSMSRGPWVPAFLVETPLQRPQGNLVIMQNWAF